MIISDKIYCKKCGTKVYRYKLNHLRKVHKMNLSDDKKAERYFSEQ